MPAHKSHIRFLLLVLVASIVAGCGSYGSSSQSAGPSATATPPSNRGGSQSEPSAAFKGPRSIVRFGREASVAEREAAAQVLKENLDAREEADFATQCASLTFAAQKAITWPARPAVACQRDLKKLAEPLSSTSSIRANNFSGSIAVLRVKGQTAYALYHGKDGKDWAMPLAKESGVWKVGSITTTELR